MTSGYPEHSARYLIHGQWRAASDCADVINPAQVKEVVGAAALCSQNEALEAIDSAESAFAAWSLTKPDDRMERMRKAAALLQQAIEEHVSLYVRENGKVLVEAKKDLMRCVEIMTGSAAALKAWWMPETLEGAQRVQIRRRPRGVAVVIAPWNSPLILTLKRVVPAVLTGNTVVVKPATSCPLTIMSVLNIIASCFPPGVINAVTGPGRTLGETLCTDRRVRTVAFVGSTDTGKEIMRLASGTVKKLYLELGGNDPALVLEDAVLDEAAIRKLRMGVLRAAGQVCSAVKRIYVHQSRYEELAAKLKAEFAKVVVGNGIHPDATMGPLHNQFQFDYVRGLLERAEKSGARVERLGRRMDPESWDDGYFLEPTIVTGADHASEIVRVEQFGPVIPIIPCADTEEAVRWANDTDYGLRASVWTADERKAAALADRLQAGAVFHNNHTIFQNLLLDFPGAKESGLNRETRHASFESFADSYGFAD